LIVSVHGICFPILLKEESTLEKTAEVLQKVGINYISLPLLNPEWANPETITKREIARIKETVKSYDVKVSSFGCIWPSYYMMVATSDSELRRNLNYCRKLFDLAAALDVKVMNLGGGRARTVPAGRDWGKALESMAQLWREACKHAEDKGVVVAIESNGKGLLGDTIREQMDLVKMVDSPSFGIVADFRFMARLELSIPDSLRAAGDMVKLIHIADDNNRIPGKGSLDFNKIFKTLKDIGYDGELCIECGFEEDYMGELREAKRFIEAKWRQA